MSTPSPQHLHAIDRKLVTEQWLRDYEIKGSGWLRILSNSMFPLIQINDQIHILKVKLTDIGLGDIITFWKGSMLITHRVVRKVKQGRNISFYERADNFARHSFVDGKTVVGRVVQVRKANGIIDLSSFRWRLRNKTIGLFYYCALVLRSINRRFPYVPRGIKKLFGKILQVIVGLKDKMLRSGI